MHYLYIYILHFIYYNIRYNQSFKKSILELKIIRKLNKTLIVAIQILKSIPKEVNKDKEI